jgi:GDP-4-dehydro-6-deoxy-D-mannose reductase
MGGSPVNVLVTGVTGFAGAHLARFLVDQPGVNVFGLKRWNSPLNGLSGFLDKITLMDFDLGDPHSINHAVAESRPDRIFHLAAQSHVPPSFRAPTDTIRANVLGTVALLEAVRANACDPVIHVCSSSEVYGQVPEDELPIDEDTKFRPQSPYGVSKVGQDLIAYQYYVSYGMNIIRTRTFTYIGPGGRKPIAALAFARQIAEFEQTARTDPIIRVGNLESIRTFSDIRDVVRAYWMLTEKCPPGEVYNIAGTYSCTVGELLDSLLSLSTIQARVEIDPELFRPSDITRQIVNASKFRRATGWTPQISFEQSLQDLLYYWREQVSR